MTQSQTDILMDIETTLRAYHCVAIDETGLLFGHAESDTNEAAMYLAIQAYHRDVFSERFGGMW